MENNVEMLVLVARKPLGESSDFIIISKRADRQEIEDEHEKLKLISKAIEISKMFSPISHNFN